MGGDEPDSPADDWAPEQFHGRLLALARRLLGRGFAGKIDPEELVQTTFLKAYARRAQLKDKARLYGWLRTILRHTLLDAVDQVFRRKECSLADLLEQSSTHLEELLEADQSSPSAQAMSEEERARLAGALAQLPPDWRAALELWWLEGHSVAEAGELMDRSRGAASGMITRALKRLGELLEPRRGGPS